MANREIEQIFEAVVEVDETYVGKTPHRILDNYSTHTAKETTGYLRGEQVKDRFVLHFIPTRLSWLNLVERRFAEIRNKRIRRESWESVAQLRRAI